MRSQEDGSGSARKKAGPKNGAILWPKNGRQKGEGRQSALTLWGANFGPPGGESFLGARLWKRACGRREPAGGNSARGGSDSTPTHFTRWQCKARDADVTIRTSHGSPHMRAAALARPEAACLHRHCGTPPLLRKKGVHGRIPRAPGVLSAMCLKHTAWPPRPSPRKENAPALAPCPGWKESMSDDTECEETV